MRSQDETLKVFSGCVREIMKSLENDSIMIAYEMKT